MKDKTEIQFLKKLADKKKELLTKTIELYALLSNRADYNRDFFPQAIKQVGDFIHSPYARLLAS